MTYKLNSDDLTQLKQIGLENMIRDFGYIIGHYMGGDDESEKEARTYMRDFFNVLSRELDPDNHVDLYEEDDC